MSISETYRVDFNFADNEVWIDHELQEAATDFHITEVFSPDGDLIGINEGAFYLELEAGVYRARIKKYGLSKDTLFVVNGEEEITLESPQRHSSAPIAKVVGSHEYYSGRFLEKSYTCTGIEADSCDAGSLSIFVRMRDEKEAKSRGNKNLFTALYLTDCENNLLTDFSTDQINFNYDYGFARFRAQLNPGYYRLYSVWYNRAQWIPIHIFPGRDCDMSMLWDDKPLYSTMVMFFPERLYENNANSYEYERHAQGIDAVMQTLSSGYRSRHVKSSMVNYLLHGKFDDPMLGIMGLYLVLLGNHPEKTDIHTILDRMRFLLPDSPDVEALHYIAWEKDLIECKIWNFGDIPMLRLGAMAMQRALNSQPYSFDFPNTIPPMAEEFFLGFTNYSVWAQSQMNSASLSWLRAKNYLSIAGGEEKPLWLLEAVESEFQINESQKHPLSRKDFLASLAMRYNLLLPTLESILNQWRPPPKNPVAAT